MCDLMFASSPSWYCSRAVDADQRGFLYFAANYNLYVLNIECSPPKFVLHLHAHQQRAVGVSVSTHNESWQCCTIGEDGKTKIWNLEKQICVDEHTAHKHPLTCVHWSPVNKDMIVTSDNKGGIVVWQPSTSEFKYFCPEGSHIFSLSCSPHRKDFIAVGYKSSTILILNVEKNGQIVQRLRGHDEEIHGICWCPEIGEDPPWLKNAFEGDHSAVDANSGNGCLLASSSKDRTIRVWAMSSGRSLITLKLPHSTGGGRREKYDDRTGSRVWVGLHWPANKSMELISSSFNGDMLLWDLGRQAKQKWQLITASKNAKAHGRVVFNVVTGGKDFNTLCTASMDRQIVLWDLTTLKAKLNIPTLGGFGYCMATSPVNPGRVAIGAGDSLIRIWNVDNVLNPFDAQMFWQGLKSKVTALGWHPVKEGTLAYGTEDGRVGIYEVCTNKSPQISSTYHRGTVYNVTWGPPCVNAESFPNNTYFLYSCGDGKILQHEPYQLDKEALNVTKYIREINNIQGKSPGHTEISFKPDMTNLAAGNDDGSIDIMSVPGLKKLASVHVHRKLINVIKWHPEYTADSRELSPYRAWIATGSGEPNVHIMDLTEVLENRNEEKTVVVTESTCQLIGHTNRITQLSWSCFTQGMLASASYDHTVQIWDVKSCRAVANYRGHYGRLMCVQWSELDADVVYSGGQDNTVQCWHISQQEHTVPPTSSGNSERKKKTKKKKANNTDEGLTVNKTSSPRKENKEESLEDIQNLLDRKRQELLAEKSVQQHTNSAVETILEKVGDESLLTVQGEGVDSTMQNLEDISAEDLVETETESLDGNTFETSIPEMTTLIKKDGRDKKKKKGKSLLPKSSLRDNRGKSFQHEDCVTLATYLYKEKEVQLGEDLLHIGHFIDKKSTFEMINFEAAHHKSQDNYEQYAVLEIMKGNIGALLTEAANNNQLSDWLVGLSPLGSSSYWRDICAQFAQQLEKDGHCHKAMSYLLASNKVGEAIDVLVRSGAYKDAVCLARLRLSPLDPKLKSIYLHWAGTLAKDSNLEMAAKCYLACMEPIEAAKCLARRSDLSALKAAAMVCIIVDELDPAMLYIHRLIQDCYVLYDWSTPQEVIVYHKQFQHYSLPLSCHELMVAQLVKMQVLPEDILKSACPSSDVTPCSEKIEQKLPTFIIEETENDELCPWPMWLVNGELFCMSIIRLWVTKWDVSLTVASLTEFYTSLKKMKADKHGLLQLYQVLVNVSFDIVLGIIQMLLGDGDLAVNHWALAIATCVDHNQEELAEGLCRLLVPQGVEKIPTMAQQIHALVVSGADSVTLSVRKLSLSHKQNENMQASIESHARSTVNCDHVVCKPIDSLRAYYHFCVLKHWLSSTRNRKLDELSSIRKSTPVKSVINLSEIKNLHSPKDIGSYSPNKDSSRISQASLAAKDLFNEFSPVRKTNEEISSTLPSKLLPLSSDALLQVSKSLLWDVQMKKEKLENNLKYIQKAISDMITKHGATNTMSSICSDSVVSIDDGESSSMASLNEPIVSPLNLKRAPSGEYLIMTKTDFEYVSTMPKKKPHELINITSPIEKSSRVRLSNSVNEEEEFECMESEVSECTSQCEGSGDHSHSTKISNTEHMEVDNKPPNSEPSTKDILNNLTDNEKTIKHLSKSGDEKDDLESAVFTIGGSSAERNVPDSIDAKGEQLSATALAYANLPDDWFELPLDIRYASEDVNLQILTAEQQSVQAQLQHINQQVQINVFPPVMESAEDIIQLITDPIGANSKEILGQPLVTWIDKHKYLTIHSKTLEQLNQYLNC